MENTFEEKQRFTNPVFWFAVLGSLILLLTIALYQDLTGELLGNNPTSSFVIYLIVLIIYASLILLELQARLITRINITGVYYGWKIINDSLNRIRLNEISNDSIINYKWVGFGYKISKKYGEV